MDVQLVPEEQLKKYAHLLERAAEINQAEASQQDFMEYTKTV
jgi:hypothetical protein